MEGDRITREAEDQFLIHLVVHTELALRGSAYIPFFLLYSGGEKSFCHPGESCTSPIPYILLSSKPSFSFPSRENLLWQKAAHLLTTKYSGQEVVPSDLRTWRYKLLLFLSTRAAWHLMSSSLWAACIQDASLLVFPKDSQYMWVVFFQSILVPLVASTPYCHLQSQPWTLLCSSGSLLGQSQDSGCGVTKEVPSTQLWAAMLSCWVCVCTRYSSHTLLPSSSSQGTTTWQWFW